MKNRIRIVSLVCTLVIIIIGLAFGIIAGGVILDILKYGNLYLEETILEIVGK